MKNRRPEHKRKTDCEAVTKKKRKQDEMAERWKGTKIFKRKKRNRQNKQCRKQKQKIKTVSNGETEQKFIPEFEKSIPDKEKYTVPTFEEFSDVLGD